MSKTLMFSERLLDLGCEFLRRGRDQEALDVLGKLAGMDELPDDVSEDVEVHIAEIYLRQRKYKKARRHLDAALLYKPECARYHHLMATILDEADDCDAERVLHHFGMAAELDPHNPEYLADYGLCLLDAGDIDEGLASLEKAVAEADEPHKYLQLYTFNLIEHGHADRARKALVAAMFGNTGDQRLRRLWDEMRFREAQCTQQRYRTSSAESEAVFLTFPRKKAMPARRTVERDDEAILRIDAGESMGGSHLGQKVRQAQTQG